MREFQLACTAKATLVKFKIYDVHIFIVNFH